MKALDDTDRQQLRAALEQRKAELLSELGAVQREVLRGLEGNADGDAGDSKEQVEQQARGAVRDAEAARDHDELVAVRAALARLAAGHYGECVDCGAAIGRARLLAQPAAARCVACQERLEART